MLRIKRTHSALILLTTFILGSVIIPGVHELCHVIDSNPPNETNTPITHLHVEYDAFGDLDAHAEDVELSCELCALTLNGFLAQNNLVTFSDSGSYYVDSLICADFAAVSSISIRGPPVHMFI